MIRVIGSNNCGRCEMTKTILTSKGLEFKYELLSDLPKEEQKDLLTKARAKGQMSMPIIILNDNVVNLQEVK